MRLLLRFCAVLLSLTVITFGDAVSAHASTAPRWSTAQLADFADVVVTGRVEAVTSGWDPDTAALYTYVALHVREVLKGDLSERRITIKQLGGVKGGLALEVNDQASFAVGEEVLLYLESRPRDGTLYTAALWQGKWALERDVRGQRMAVRRAPHDARRDRQPLSGLRRESARARPGSRRVRTLPLETPSLQSSGFQLLGPFRYLFSPIIDVQQGGQPGLSGGGVAQVRAAAERWNRAGAAFRYQIGTTNALSRCAGDLVGNGRVTIVFMDPCGEISNTGGTVAVGGSYFSSDDGGTANGQQFLTALEGFVINNDSAVALELLTQPGCFETIQTHELGHVLGLGHSSDSTAIMFPTVDRSCTLGARELAADDVFGVRFVYPDGMPRNTPPATVPMNVQVTVNDASTVDVSWAPVTEYVVGLPSAAASYRVEFREGHDDGGAIVGVVRVAATSVRVAIPDGLSGRFNVRVTALNPTGDGAPSIPRPFTICRGTPSILAIDGAVFQRSGRVRWIAGAADGFIGQAGTTPGGVDLQPPVMLGDVRSVSVDGLAAGFAAWVRITPINACGARGAPADVFVR